MFTSNGQYGTGSSTGGYGYYNQSNKIYVNSYEDVVRYQLPPNTSFIFIDRMKPLVYDKVTDAYGGFTIKTYNISEATEAKPDDAITKSDLQKIMDRLCALENKDKPEEV